MLRDFIYQNMLRMTSIYRVPAILLMAVIVWSLLFPSGAANAQSGQQCPLHSDVQVRVLPTKGSDLLVEKDHTTEVVLSNQNSHFLPGVRIAIALFAPGDATTPRYWRVGGETYMLAPAAEMTIPLEASLAMVPAGDYLLKAFAFQGSELDLLGVIFRDSEKAAGVPLKKTAARATEVSLTVSVDGEMVSTQKTLPAGHIPELRVETKSLSATPLVDVTLVSVVSLGDIPLGGAVVASAIDKTTLLPKFARINDFSTQPYGLTTSGIMIATLIDGLNFTPLKVVELSASGGDTDLSWPYVSRIGFSQYPLLANGEIVSCVSYSGKWQQLDYWPELLQGSLKITARGMSIYSKTVYSDQDQSSNHFSFTPGVALGTFDMKFSLLNQRLNSVMTEGTAEQMLAQTKSSLTVADERKFTITCSGEECRAAAFPTQDSNEVGTNNGSEQPFLFYAGIVLAAALLMYLMLRRLGTSPAVDAAKKLNPDELQ